MNNDFKCPQCGAPLPANAPAGLCPQCLMALNLKTETMFSDDSPAAQAPLPPDQIAPHFPQLEILECLGRGGMGVVYKARQKTLNRIVALKLLAPERIGDPKFAERFTREAQALAALNHPNILTIHDFGQAGGFYFLLMEYVDGANLRHLLRAQKFTPEEALAIVPPLCEALQYAHERGIVHRDIKPENLLLDKTGRVKIADFGIAKMLGGNGGAEVGGTMSPEAATQNVVGTRGYSAPEQQNAPQRVDNRADIYSLGVVLYEMLTGELPGKTIEAPSRKVHIDVRLDEVVLRALEKTPELRWQTAAEMRTQVETIVGEHENKPDSGQIMPKDGIDQPNLFRGFTVLGIVLLLLGLTFLGLAYAAHWATVANAPAISKTMQGMSSEQISASPAIRSWSLLAHLGRNLFFPLGIAGLSAGLLAFAAAFFGVGRGPTGLELMPKVTAWLEFFDRGDYGGSWDAASQKFKRLIKRAEWVEKSSITRQPLGRVISRRVRKVHKFGGQLVVKYDTVFGGLKASLETVVFCREADGQWRAQGYLILPAYAEEDRLKKKAREAMWFSAFAGFGCVAYLCSLPHLSGFLVWAIPVLAFCGVFYGAVGREYRWGRVAMYLGLTSLLAWLLISVFAAFQTGVSTTGPANLADSPQELLKLPTPQVIQAGLSKPDSPWPWQELERRQLSSNQVAQIMDGVTAWLHRDYPHGHPEPLNWLDNFLDHHLFETGLMTDNERLNFLEAVNGDIRGSAQFREPEGTQRLPVSFDIRYLWRQDFLGLVLMNEVQSATVDGQPLKIKPDAWGWDGNSWGTFLELPPLGPGTHQFKLEVLSAFVEKDDLNGLSQQAPSSDWPPAKKKWVRTAERDLLIYATNATVVTQTEDPALDPVRSGGLVLKQVIIRSKGKGTEAYVNLDVNSKLPVDVSFAVALRIGSEIINCGHVAEYIDTDGKFTITGGELKTDITHPAPDIKVADVILTPAPDAVAETAAINRIWGGKVVFSGIMLRRLDNPDTAANTP